MNTTRFYSTVSPVKTCFRCGDEFRTHAGRICAACRKPRVRARTTMLRGLKLTYRETQVARLVREAKLNKEIAFELHLTEGTIKEYLNRIFRKLGLRNRTDLAIWAMHNLQTAA